MVLVVKLVSPASTNDSLVLICLDSHEDYSLGLCGYILLALSYVLICLTFPFSLTVCLKVSFELALSRCC